MLLCDVCVWMCTRITPLQHMAKPSQTTSTRDAANNTRHSSRSAGCHIASKPVSSNSGRWLAVRAQ